MPRPPAFWQHAVRSPWVPLLAPIGAIVAAITARRVAQTGWRAPVPVICCGNVTVGGAGKTTVALDVGQRLSAFGVAVHFLLRGYGGTVRGPHRVAAADAASLVGDEALLLAQVAPTWVGADRAASARAAISAGAQALVLDDGLQNPTLVKDLSLLVMDGATGFGNGRVIPAGPLRETVAAAAARCQAAVLIGPDATGAAAQLPTHLTQLHARLEPGREVAGLIGHRVLAFAGLALPDKFFNGLTQTGVEVVARRPFPDHHPYAETDLRTLLANAARLDAVLVTTPKDAVRLPGGAREKVQVIGVTLVWEDEAALNALLASVIPGAVSV